MTCTENVAKTRVNRKEICMNQRLLPKTNELEMRSSDSYNNLTYFILSFFFTFNYFHISFAFPYKSTNV